MGWNFFDTNGSTKKVTIEASADLPLGTVLQYASNTVPTGWLLCDGTAISRTTFADLFALLGTSYGVGNGTTTFNLPDLRGRVPVGKNAGTFPTLGGTGGAETHTLTTGQMPSHQHGPGAYTTNVVGSTVISVAAYQPGGTSFFAHSGATFTGTVTSGLSAAEGGGGSHNNLQPFQVVNYIIKAEHVVAATNLDFQAGRAKYNTTDTITNAGSSQKIALTGGTLEYDTDGYFDVTNQRFTVPAGKSGLYTVTAEAVFPATGATTGIRSVSIRVNNSLVSADQGASTGSTSADTFKNCTVDVELADGDYVEIWAAQNSSVTPMTVTGTLSVKRISGSPTPSQEVQPQVRAYRTTNQSIPSGTNTAIQFDAERWDTDNIHSTITNNTRFTVTTPGLYAMVGTVAFAANATGTRQAEIMLNGSNLQLMGSTRVNASTTAGFDTRITSATQYRMAAGDYVEFTVRQDSGAPLDALSVNLQAPEFSMVRISA